MDLECEILLMLHVHRMINTMFTSTVFHRLKKPRNAIMSVFSTERKKKARIIGKL